MKTNKISLELDTSTIEQLVEKMPMAVKIRLVRKLEKETLAKRIDELLNKIEQRGKKYPISQTKILEEIQIVRRQIYGSKGGS
ncbi:MAG: hypothetical protein FJZ16_08660 [Candidatus Omnitrophica bacterium]|nr:hypothetical protein [Candidatus Omnitrophota bacterium]